MLEDADRTTRLRLLRIVAAAAWVDGEVQPDERAFVEKLLAKLPMALDEKDIALGYLDKAPHPAEIDPTKVPPEHREALMKLVWQVLGADGQMTDDEQTAAQELEDLLQV
jgi:uncharacterized tellurite resistance protein B-like protein